MAILSFAVAATKNVNAVELITYGDTNTPMGETLAFSKDSFGLDLNEAGFYKFSVAFTGLTGFQTNPQQGNSAGINDISNGQLIIEKNSGPLQLFAVIGPYSIIELGSAYTQSDVLTKNSWGYLPAGWVKIPAGEELSISIGNLFAIGGSEGTFTYENTNIQRGLLWSQTSSISRGFQIDYVKDDFFASIALTDGSYSGTYNWLGAQFNYQLNNENAVTFSWNGSLSENPKQTFATPLLQNNSQISTFIYSYKTPKYTLTPYLQYTFVPARPGIGIMDSSSTQGAALLATYRHFPLNADGSPPRRNVSLPVRFEYLKSTGNTFSSPDNLLFGPNSSAWSATITPTYQLGMYFARAEISYVQAINISPGTAYGSSGNMNNQTRFMLEAGILF